MNTIEIIALLAIIAIGILYYLKFQQVKKLKEEISTHDKKMQDLSWLVENHRNAEKNAIEQSLIDQQKSQLLEAANSEMKSDLDQLQIHIENLETDNHRLQSQLDQAQEQVRENTLDFNIIDPVRQTDFPYSFQADIDWGTINLSIKDLIGDDKLLEVFNSLVKSNLLPESIKDSIDYEPKEQICYIYTNTHDEEGDTISSLSWKGITNQILNKKQIVTDYLRGVIQDSDRAMVVHMALTSKPKKEVNNA